MRVNYMGERKAIGFLLLFFAFIMLATCQLQLNKVANSLDLRVRVPARATSGPTGPTGPVSLASGTGVTLTITNLAGAQLATSNMLAINGSSVSYTFSLASGSYLASAELFGGSGNLLSQASTPFAVPVQTNPVTLSVASGQLVVSYVPYGASVPTQLQQNYGYQLSPPVGTSYVFQVQNVDPSNTLYPFGSSPVTITNNYGDFILSSQLPSTPIPPGGSADFAIELVSNSGGSETVTLRTSDPSNTPFVFSINPC
jgi:hypothetical protein